MEKGTQPVGAQSTKSGWLSWGSKGTLTLIDQGLIGGSNFLIALLLARRLSPSQYGAYALAFEIFMVLTMAYACVILEPMLVFGSSTYGDNFRQYFRLLLWMHSGIVLVISVVLGGSAFVVHESRGSSSLASSLAGVMIATPCVLLFWLARRAFYVRLDPKTAVIGGLLYCVMLLGGVLLFYELRLLSSFIAFLLMAAGGLAAAPLLLARLKRLMESGPLSLTLREVCKTHWVYGRWALAGALATWISGQVYYLLLSSMRGLADTGALKALLNFASPIGQVSAALFMLILPYAASTHQKSGAIGLKRLSWRLTLLYSAGAVAYWIVFLFLKNPVVHFLYGAKYSAVEHLIPYVALGSVFRIATTVQIVSLKAVQSPFLSFLAWVVAGIVACLVGVPAVSAFGLQGALWAYVLSGAASLIAGFILLRRITSRLAAEPVGSFFSETIASSSAQLPKPSIPIS